MHHRSPAIAIACLCACVDVHPAPDVASDLLLVCQQPPAPEARPDPIYVPQGDTWMVLLPERDLDLVMVDIDRLVGWQKCVTQEISLLPK